MSTAEDTKPAAPNAQEAASSTAQQSDSKPTAAPAKTESDEKSSNTAAPLAPPPKPSQANNNTSNNNNNSSTTTTNGNGQTSQTPDYFGNGSNSHFSLEPNPFEQSFGNPSTETPGKVGGLPSVASLTSPAPLGPGGTPNWQNSLRSGPLSPAMLQGPVNNQNGYFDQEFRNNYPTPNESSLRTGLTPGGGGSMFPAPSPNTQALFNNLSNGGVTPGTAEFQRAAAAAARQKGESNANGTSNNNMSKQEYQPAQQQNRQDPFTNTQESEAVNSLYMLAGAGNASRGGSNNNNNSNNSNSANQFAVANQQSALQQRIAAQQQQQQHQQSPTHGRHNGSMDLGSGVNDDEDEDMDEDKATTRGGKRGGAAGKGGQANGRRKTDDIKTPAKKRSRGNNGSIHSLDEDLDDDDLSDKDDGMPPNTGNKKMTDEEKRKNFLERNRVAALKCRQRKKQWLANLQTKVEIFTQENDALTQQCSQLREEIINLKTLLLAHKDCPVSHQQGLGGQAMAQVIGNFDPGAGANGPYGMANMHMPHMSGQGMPQGMQSGQGVQRR